jgi:hypothetical protein
MESSAGPVSSLPRSVSATSGTLVSELGGEAVILHLDSEQYFGLDEVGARMWQILMASDSVSAAFDQMLEEWDVEPERLRGDLADLIEQLRENGLVEVHAA